eukprot:TRINITY_DN9221_c0_g1_i2.p1 TRINITY_DN9221_c0_g1~~TRINITY_DN9221_c0_g1_i2.p1  ORF type:complete len:132 (+),score=35.91 TRINITY_DN9221_c0_g1_i2:157-552(+)
MKGVSTEKYNKWIKLTNPTSVMIDTLIFEENTDVDNILVSFKHEMADFYPATELEIFPEQLLSLKIDPEKLKILSKRTSDLTPAERKQITEFVTEINNQLKDKFVKKKGGAGSSDPNDRSDDKQGNKKTKA